MYCLQLWCLAGRVNIMASPLVYHDFEDNVISVHFKNLNLLVRNSEEVDTVDCLNRLLYVFLPDCAISIDSYSSVNE